MLDHKKGKNKMPVSNLTALCFTMGRQGGTVHEVADTLGVSVSDITDADDVRMGELLRLAQQFRNKTGKFKRIGLKNPENLYIVEGNPEWWDNATGDGVEEYVRAKSIRGSFFAGDRPTGKFAALYGDGSGAALFIVLDGRPGKELYCTHTGISVEYDWFVDAGYSIWIRIPQEFDLYFERIE